MELVRAFNSELSSIYESKPPVSKAKMASITRYAVKALKYYKHIVYSVEKFMQKCRNEYKIAGLYVLDSIIRQSRHQFGAEKDLFGPRFQKNLKYLFQHIYQCPHEDKPKIVRVLNLWQKNGIYSPEVISPLVDMASVSSKVLATSIQRHKKAQKASRETMLDDSDFVNSFEPSTSFEESHSFSSSSSKRKKIQMSQDDEIQVLKAQLEQQRKQQELLQQQLQMQIMSTKQQSLQMQLQQQQIHNKLQEQLHQNMVDTNRGLAQPDGSSSRENLVATIQEISQQLERDKQSLSQLNEKDITSSISDNNVIDNQAQFLENFQQLIQTAKGMVQKDPRQSNTNEGFEASLQTRQEQPHPFEYDESGNTQDPRKADHRHRNDHEDKWSERRGDGFHQKHEDYKLPKPDPTHVPPPHKKPLIDCYNDAPQPPSQIDDDDAMQIDNDDEYNVRQEHYGQQVSFVDNANQRRSRWGPAQEGSKPQDEVQLNQAKVDEKKQALKKQAQDEETKRREKPFMPPALSKQMTIASITVWVGRLPKGIHPNVIHMAFSEYGEVRNIDLIDARGCCFVTMSCRSEADRAFRHLKHRKIDGYDVKMAWGQPQGLEEFSKFWDESFGAAFIPWEYVKANHLEEPLDGCIIDESTIPPALVMPKPTLPVEQTSEKMEPPSIPAPPMFLNNLPHGMLPPPPPPGMLPPGFRPPLLPAVLPLGMRPPPGAPQLPTILPTLQQMLSNQGAPRPPLLQVPGQSRNLDPRVSSGPVSSQPPSAHFPVNRPPFQGNRPPFSMRGGELVFNRPRIPVVTESGVNYLPLNIARPPLIGVEKQHRGFQKSVFPQNSQHGHMSGANFTGDSEDSHTHNENVSMIPPHVSSKQDAPEERSHDRNLISEQGSRIQERLRDEGRDRQYRNDGRGRELERERRDSRERRNDRDHRRDERFDRRERRDDRFERRDEKFDRARRDRNSLGDRGRHERSERDGGRGNRDRSRNRSGRDEFGRDEDRYKRNDREETRKSPKLEEDAENRKDGDGDSKPASFKSTFTSDNTTSEVMQDKPKQFVPFTMATSVEKDLEKESKNILSEEEPKATGDLSMFDDKTKEGDNDEATEDDGDELYDPLAEDMSPVNGTQGAVAEQTLLVDGSSRLDHADNGDLKAVEANGKSRDSPIFPIDNKDDAIYIEKDVGDDDTTGGLDERVEEPQSEDNS